MKNNLDDAFNITPTQVEVDETDVVVGVDREKPDRLTKDDITKDYEYTPVSYTHLTLPTIYSV